MAVRRWVVCLFRQAIEQTRYREKVNRSCNANRHHPSECHSPVWQFCEPTGHRSLAQLHVAATVPLAASHPPAFPTSPHMVKAENGKQKAARTR
jgi:hypothetical protein